VMVQTTTPTASAAGGRRRPAVDAARHEAGDPVALAAAE
jgi:hypothetical protein